MLPLTKPESLMKGSSSASLLLLLFLMGNEVDDGDDDDDDDGMLCFVGGASWSDVRPLVALRDCRVPPLLQTQVTGLAPVRTGFRVRQRRALPLAASGAPGPRRRPRARPHARKDRRFFLCRSRFDLLLSRLRTIHPFPYSASFTEKYSAQKSWLSFNKMGSVSPHCQGLGSGKFPW